MTLKIEVTVERDDVMAGAARQYLDRALSSIGYQRHETHTDEERTGPRSASGGVSADAQPAPDAPDMSDATVVNHVRPLADEAAETKAMLDTRPVGSPSEGNKRRNSAEKTEDDALEALAAEKGVSTDQLNNAIATAGRSEARQQLAMLTPYDEQTETRSISTGEERVSPDDDPETEATDAADEARETADVEQEPISVLRKLMGQYQRKFGMAEATKLCADGGVIGAGIADLDDAQIDKAIEDVSRLLDVKGGAPAKVAEPAKPEPVKEAAKAPTKEDVIAAMTRYAAKFDGETQDQTKMKATLEDVPKIFQLIFGPAIEKLSHVPASGYAKAIAGIDEAIAKNPFKREVK